ncbi:hypothetical protein [Massilia sp. ZL223]|uniref:hypothetical protein n=1 Tax=Massilia sp. ZL223 TaxID=2824904 RepID=UPI001B83905D|nr:hypothetical protein [Massilia sp. ZL223]MBQ5965079.1 hypothetical protein [Massilia sp. ZL223]
MTSQLLNSYLHLNMRDICPHGYADEDLNHCAHFVSHVLNVAAGSITCRGMSATKAAGRIGVCIRVHELFAACEEVGFYKDASAGQLASGVFVFVCAKNNPVRFQPRSFQNVPRKHVGIGLGGEIWHYSNGKDMVVTATPDDFRKHYAKQINELYFGTFPKNSFPSSLNCGR